MPKGLFINHATGERVERELESAEIARLQESDVDKTARLNLEAKSDRLGAYRAEADPIFFRYQRGTATEQEWLDAVQAIKDRYPYSNEA